MGLRGAIASLAQGGPFTVTRTAEGDFGDDSVYTSGAQTTFTIVASIQPVTGRELQDRDLVDTQRGDEVCVVYTTTELRTRKKDNDPDVITYRDEPWTVTKVEQFDAFGETHYRAYIARTESP